MANDFWRKIDEIFPLVADLPDERERERRLRELCAGDERLRREIAAMLAVEEKAAEFIETPLMMPDSLSRAFAGSGRNGGGGNPYTLELAGRQIGSYRVVRKLGAGGMGAVYLAERADNEFRKRAAIKLVKRGADTEFNLRRFRHERQILAQLEHPNIARLLDGGTTEDGSPYFVMEYVEGKPLFDFCAAHDFDLSQRLRLFRQILAAVSYAHGQGVVHRDLKPGNILVARDGTIRLLDFGIAKILDSSDSIHDSIGQTETLLRQMTPEYASPEQICGEEITAASDVYSLGVCLYELLTGERPYKFTSRAPHEIARVICEEPVRAPQFSAGGLSSDDLKFIVLKSLRKKPFERYASAADFDADIARFLEGSPVLTDAEQTKFLEREKENTDQASVSPAIAPFEVSPIVNETTSESRTTADAVSRTTGGAPSPRRLKIKRAAAVTAAAAMALFAPLFFYFAVFRGVKIIKLPHNQPPVADAPKKNNDGKNPLSVDAAASELYQAGTQQLETRSLDGVNRAIKLFAEATKRDPNFALAFSGLADAHIVLADKDAKAAATAYRSAEEYALKALALDPDLAEARTSLAMTTYKNTGNVAAAEKHFLRAIEINPSLSRAHHWYSQILRASKRHDEALREITIAAELEPRSAIIHYNVGVNNLDLRRYSEAIAYLDKAIQLDGNYVNSYLLKAIVQQMLGDYNGALETYRIGRIYSGKDENEPLWILVQAQAHAAGGRRDEALALVNRLLRNPAQREKTSKLPFDIALVHNLLGDANAACDWLEKIEPKEMKDPEAIGRDPRFANLRGNQRYEQLAEKWRSSKNAHKTS